MNDEPEGPPVFGSCEAGIGELRIRRAEASKLGGAEAVAEYHGQGRLTICERIDGWSTTGPFRRSAGLPDRARYADGKLASVTPAPYVMGFAAIDGRPVAVGGEDFTVRGGTSWSGDRKGGQGGFIEDLADGYRIPLVNLIDGSGGSVTSHQPARTCRLSRRARLRALGRAAGRGPRGLRRARHRGGGPAGRAILSHWSVMVKDTSQVFAAGPPVVERSLGQKITKEDLGGAAIAVDFAGTIDNRAETEAECSALIRRFSATCRRTCGTPPAVRRPTVDRCEDSLLRIVPAPPPALRHAPPRCGGRRPR